ncbi:30S ribosomal protein S7 [Bacteriovorax stolpii]|uniref:Small ribosomal subunit protein uS7 n=1 Tax=Bacteriovorax stolpii TaxID=960 RepID=A0A2K9NZ76_BACTC|nr:30S ribosomal protein S7 [Bacteriovorax stolpii]AUN99994.1 30S ribosomal protein S7 [Bacteriovorax stolpii]QDK40013.1 30S ribosomal protein S7 [Bacteriovorax stolpii]TDP54114.1 SSU ribosomal protein S7P [Bacteriovorax stolpii]BDT30183.1 30S ribosomal protein S7 [Bacteriovorax sp. HI3]
MSRKRKADVREVLPDPVYQDIVITKFMNTLMIGGKKSVAEKIFYGALEVVQEKTGEEPLKVFKKALSNIKPAVEVKSRRIGGATYQIPVEVRPARRQSLALRWLKEYSSARSGKTMVQKLADEIIDASQNRGGSVKKREDVYKMAEANKAFAHLKW